MTILATLFGSLVAFRRIRGQADLIQDVSKIAVIVAIGTAIISFVSWTATHYRQDKNNRNIGRGIIAGLLTSLIIIPLPVFSWAFKNELITRYHNDQDSLASVVLSSIAPALEIGAMSFLAMYKPAIVAIIASMFVGWAVAKLGPNPHANFSVSRQS